MRKIIAWGIFFVISCLFSLFEYPVVNNTNEIIKPKFEAIDAQEMMDKIVVASDVIHEEDSGIAFEDAQMLMKIAMAEAEGDGIEGKAMVMAVVLNRVNDDRFPDSVKEVIFQDKQFSPIKDGRYEKAEPDIECHLALAEIEKGNYADVEALYFENASDSWQARNCTYLGTIGHHRFYKN